VREWRRCGGASFGTRDALCYTGLRVDGHCGQPRIAILGWGSLLWDESHKDFDERHEDWKFDGPILKLEFSRKSVSRGNALTLVIDPAHEQECQVAYALSKRTDPEEAIADLCAREKYTGCCFADNSRGQCRDPNSIDVLCQ
jgi:hypothetical protein